ncbi:MAG: hypothetical protein OXN89_13625 [Bryobacterales bacterium]|nr:hypothetical protein [Bryobacterales bacterium]
MNRISGIAVAIIACCGMASGIESRTAVPVFVDQTNGDGGQMSDTVQLELMKRIGLIKATVDIVRRPAYTRYVLEVSISYQCDWRRRTICKTERATAVAFAMAHDNCVRLVHSKLEGDRDMFGDADGVIETKKMAASFKEAQA